MQNTFAFKCPTFPIGTFTNWDLDGVIVNTDNQSCRVQLTDNTENRAFIDYLISNKSKPYLKELLGQYNNHESLKLLVHDFDQLGMLSETVFDHHEGIMSGAQFYREMKRYSEQVAARLGPCSLSLSLQNGQTKRNQLIGYLCEYFHIVYRFAETISPAISTCLNENIRQQFIKYYTSELNHSQFIESALGYVGITKDQLLCSEPLPWTFALSCSLGASARQHFISLICMLDIFEQSTDEFYQLFKNRAISLGFKESFYKPILQHAHVNNLYQHDHIAKNILNLMPVINIEDIQIAKKNILILLETFHAQSKEIIEFYANPALTLPRIYERN